MWTGAGPYDGDPVATFPPKRRRLGAGLALVVLVTLLFVPDPTPASPPPAGAEPFVWDRDELWAALQTRFEQAKAEGCERTTPELDARLGDLESSLAWLAEGEHDPDDPRFDDLERHLFATAPLFGACPSRAPELVAAVERMRAALKIQSRAWDIASPTARRRVYRLLHGGRAAVEELLLQGDPADVPGLTRGTDEPSRTPSAEVEGVTVHSGDILVSRGGAPTSALIARGNDYPGSFSHIALLHVAEDGTVRVVEAHIQVGVTVSSVATYLADKKLRIMVLRLDHTLPAMEANPMLPHEVATAALEEAESRRIPYDFAMEYDDPTEMFCSEVASAAYRDAGILLWEGLTSMSSRGVTSWLSRFGVERFVTHGPADLEYDPMVVVVAEWRDPEALFDDHVDTAIIDAMLEGAERGDEVGYGYPMLPLMRLAKAYSLVLNLLGRPGPVPEGMSATRALRVQWLKARHAAIEVIVRAQIEDYRAEKSSTPPYWELVAMSREALEHIDS